MILNLLNDSYLNSETIFTDFVEDKIKDMYKYRSSVNIEIENLRPFPIYAGVHTSIDEKQLMLEAFKVIDKYYLKLDRELLLNQNFWHTLFLVHYRDYIIELYPEVLESEKAMRNILLKKFDWENYIYKAVLGAQYIHDNFMLVQREKYYNLILDNLDLYNYIIKYRIFRNDSFLINVLNIIDEHEDLSSILKAKIKDRDDLGKDERYGRRVIFELNKAYPVLMSPMMDYEDFKTEFLSQLKKYYPSLSLT